MPTEIVSQEEFAARRTGDMDTATPVATGPPVGVAPAPAQMEKNQKKAPSLVLTPNAPPLAPRTTPPANPMDKRSFFPDEIEFIRAHTVEIQCNPRLGPYNPSSFVEAFENMKIDPQRDIESMGTVGRNNIWQISFWKMAQRNTLIQAGAIIVHDSNAQVRSLCSDEVTVRVFWAPRLVPQEAIRGLLSQYGEDQKTEGKRGRQRRKVIETRPNHRDAAVMVRRRKRRPTPADPGRTRRPQTTTPRRRRRGRRSPRKTSP